jgi:hypothetical protein
MRAFDEELAGIETPEGFGLDFGFIDDLQAFQQNLEDLIRGVQDAIQQFVSKVNTVVWTTRGIIATFESIGEETELMIDYVDSQFGSSPGARTGPGSGGASGIFGSPPAEVTETQKIEGEVFKLEVKTWARGLKHFAAQERARLLREVGGDLIATESAKEGHDLRDLSKKYYNTPFEWRRLMVFNDKTTIELEKGEVVFIPKLNPQEAGQVVPGI